jgi:hypothetical protein
LGTALFNALQSSQQGFPAVRFRFGEDPEDAEEEENAP